MRDVNLAIRQAYYSVIEGNVTLDGKVVHFYDTVPETIEDPDTGQEIPTPYPYIVVAAQGVVPINNRKGCEILESVIQLDIVTRYLAYDGGRKDCDVIADQLYSILNNELPPKAGLHIDDSVLDSDQDIGREMDQVYTWNRRFIRFKNIVSIL